MFVPRRQYVIGDVHGHYDELLALIEQLRVYAYNPTIDQLILLGDLIDVGPKSKEVVQQCMEWEAQYNTPDEKRFVFLYGNHEDLLIDALNPLHPTYQKNPETWTSQGGEATIKSYNPKITNSAFKKAVRNPQEFLDPEHVRWLSSLPYFYVSPDYVFVHAGLPAQPLAQIYARAQANDPELWHTMIWVRDEFIYSNFNWGRRVVFGHQPTAEPIVTQNKIGLNTMPRDEGKLTALEIPSLSFFYQPKL